jgi:hypothetical protein
MSGGDDAAVRDLCGRSLKKKTPRRSINSWWHCRPHSRNNRKEARLRMSRLARHYRRHISEPEQGSPGSEPSRFRGLRGLLETGLGLSLGRSSNRSQA